MSFALIVALLAAARGEPERLEAGGTRLDVRARARSGWRR